MIKPQFEVGRGRVGKGGVVRDPDARRGALIAVGEHALEPGAGVLGYHSSGLPGPKGNQETFIWLAEPGAAGALLDPAGLTSRPGRSSREGDHGSDPPAPRRHQRGTADAGRARRGGRGGAPPRPRGDAQARSYSRLRAWS